MAGFISYGIGFILLVLILELISSHKEIKNFGDVLTLAFFIISLTLFFDLLAGKAPDYALILFSLFISTGVMYFYWEHEEIYFPFMVGLFYAGIWLSMQLLLSLIVVTFVVVISFVLHLIRKSRDVSS